MPSKLQVCCEAIMEACWLAAAVAVPLFFNISSVQVFEPDKVLVLKLLAVFSAAAWVVKWIEARAAAANRDRESVLSRMRPRLSLVIPVLALAVVYALSSFFSIAPSQSWWGSYERAQGAVTFFCYGILFLIAVMELRTSVQIRRLQYALILGSLPIAAQTILQFLGMDPLPWGSEIKLRASGSMGNPIFLGAYLVMVIPLTFGQVWNAAGMARTESGRRSGWILACGYAAALLLQIVALLCTQSRGPIIGLGVSIYIGVFIWLVLKRAPGEDRKAFPATAAVAGLVVPPVIAVIVRIAQKISPAAGLVCLGAALVIIAVIYFMLWRTAWGKRWFWLTWLAQTVALTLILAIGPARILGDNAPAFPMLGRLARLSDASASVRQCLWKTAFNAMSSAAPGTLPNGIRDPYHSLRPAIGYGPENIGFVASYYAVPELIIYHADNAVDRMHNETYDNLISTGFLGAILYLSLFAAVIYCSLRFFDLLNGKRETIVFGVFLAAGIGAGILLPRLAGSAYMAGIGVPTGLLAGLFAYAGFHACTRPPVNYTISSRHIMVLCILCAIIAHLVEISLGIAVTPTRTVFFLLIAALSLLISDAPEEKKEEPEKRRAAKPKPQQQSIWPVLAAMASLAAVVVAWCFMINTAAGRSAFVLFFKNWFVRPGEGRLGIPFSAALILVALIVCGGIFLLYAEKQHRQTQKFNFAKAAGSVAGCILCAWLAMGLMTAFFWTTLDPAESAAAAVSEHAEARLTVFIFGLFLMVAIAAWRIVASDAQRFAAAAPMRTRYSWVGLLFAIFAIAVLVKLSARPVRADMIYRIAEAYGASGDMAGAVQLFARSASLAPRVPRYRTTLGLAQSRAGGLQEESIQSLQAAVNLNPFDAAAYRGFGSMYMRSAERSPNPDARASELKQAILQFEKAVHVAPNYPEAYNEIGRCYFLLGNRTKAMEYFQRSLGLNPDYSRTYMYMGEMYFRLNEPERALQSFKEAVRTKWDNLEARKNVGFVLTLLGRYEDAVWEYVSALPLAPNDLLVLRRIASLYFKLGNVNEAMQFARRAYEVAPVAERGTLDAFTEQLKTDRSQKPEAGSQNK